MIPDLKIIPTGLLEQFRSHFPGSARTDFENLSDSELSAETFSFYTSVSAVFSSKIEGEDIDLDSFVKHKKLGINYKTDYTRKIDDLYDAYLFAQANPLSPENLSAAHRLLSKNILPEMQQGRVRKSNMFVLTDEGKIEYVATEPAKLSAELDKLYHDLAILLAADLDLETSFYFAAMLHLIFVKIHPFDDGNGRTARLLEKWFLAQKTGAKAWFLQSEKQYYKQHQNYYTNIRKLGLEYSELDYSQALDFLLMLPASLERIS